MPLATRQQRLVADLSIIADPQERLAAVVDRGRRLARLSASERSPANQIKGCASAVWLVGTLGDDGLLNFRYEAGSPVVGGFITLLCEFYSGATPAAVVATEPHFLNELGLTRNLSPTRRNGLAAVRARIRQIAQAALPR